MKVALLSLIYVAGIILVIAMLVRMLGASIPGARVTSWWRNPWKNIEVGGLIGSAHLIGWAVDLVPVTPAIEAEARKTFPVVVNEGDHLHASVFKA